MAAWNIIPALARLYEQFLSDGANFRVVFKKPKNPCHMVLSII